MINASQVFAGLPASLRDALLQSYREIAANYAEHRWEPSELNGGKLCEVVYTIVGGALSNTFALRPTKPPNMVRACRDLEMIPSDPNRVGDQSLRILIPRMLPVLYEIRNNRGVGHIGGDVDPNYMDATAVFGMASWLVAELIRVFHGVTIKEAQETADALVERKHPLIWDAEKVRRVLDPSMSAKDQTLALLYGKVGWVSIDELFTWVEYSKPALFKTRILQPLHSSRLIEYDRTSAQAKISPLGVGEVEKRILKSRVA